MTQMLIYDDLILLNDHPADSCCFVSGHFGGEQINWSGIKALHTQFRGMIYVPRVLTNWSVKRALWSKW